MLLDSLLAIVLATGGFRIGDEGQGERAFVLLTDLRGHPATYADVVAARAMKDTGLDRGQVLIRSGKDQPPLEISGRKQHIRGALQVIEVGFPQRLAYPVQAIAFGPTLTVLGLGGQVSDRVRREFERPGVLVLDNCNGITSAPSDEEILPAIRAVLRRVRSR